MSKVINLEEIENWDLCKKHSEQSYKVEKYNNGETGFHSIKINSMAELRSVIDHLLQKGLRDKLIFRGQRNSDWILQSSLEREVKSAKTSEQYNEIAQKHLANLKKSARGRIQEQFLLLGDSQKNEDELWAMGQHLGLKTPLLDWTRSFLIALFFAFHEKETETEYRCVYRLVEGLLYLDKDYKYIVEPKMDYHGRLTAQQGLFTYWGINFHIKSTLNDFYNEKIMSNKTAKELENIKRKLIAKYYISNNLRLDILHYLELFGISEETIYPDLSGIINKVNNELIEIIEQSNYSQG